MNNEYIRVQQVFFSLAFVDEATVAQALAGLMVARDEYLDRFDVDNVDKLPEGDPIRVFFTRASHLGQLLDSK